MMKYLTNNETLNSILDTINRAKKVGKDFQIIF